MQLNKKEYLATAHICNNFLYSAGKEINQLRLQLNWIWWWWYYIYCIFCFSSYLLKMLYWDMPLSSPHFIFTTTLLGKPGWDRMTGPRSESKLHWSEPGCLKCSINSLTSPPHWLSVCNGRGNYSYLFYSWGMSVLTSGLPDIQLFGIRSAQGLGYL